MIFYKNSVDSIDIIVLFLFGMGFLILYFCYRVIFLLWICIFNIYVCFDFKTVPLYVIDFKFLSDITLLFYDVYRFLS